LAVTGDDSRCRFVYRYHGAATGRDSSWLQTLPRGEKLPVEDLINAAVAKDTERFLSLSYKKAGDKKIWDPMGAVITCLRGCFTASPGNTLVQCDWAAVEPRISAWVSGEEQILERFRKFDAEGGPDLYQVGAAPFFGLDPMEVKGDYRQFGKVYELLNLYSGGWKTVQRQGKDQYRIIIDEDTARLCVDVFRAERSATVANWSNLETAAQNAMQNVNSVFRCGKTAFCFDGKHLRFRLPSGRKMTFPFAAMEMTLTPWGQYREQVHYSGVVKSQWVRCSAHGGIFHNAAVQGTGACLMRHAAKECEKAGLDIVLRAHDELIADVPAIDAERYADTLKRIMLTPPEWAKGLPLNGAGWINPRFTKI
jgi:DNA polymerase